MIFASSSVQLKECWQLGDHGVINEARTALLRVFKTVDLETP